MSPAFPITKKVVQTHNFLLTPVPFGCFLSSGQDGFNVKRLRPKREHSDQSQYQPEGVFQVA
jgi:hypothetical protein